MFQYNQTFYGGTSEQPLSLWIRGEVLLQCLPQLHPSLLRCSMVGLNIVMVRLTGVWVNCGSSCVALNSANYPICIPMVKTSQSDVLWWPDWPLRRSMVREIAQSPIRRAMVRLTVVWVNCGRNCVVLNSANYPICIPMVKTSSQTFYGGWIGHSDVLW